MFQNSSESKEVEEVLDTQYSLYYIRNGDTLGEMNYDDKDTRS